MTDKHTILHVLRNPYGHSQEEIKAARLAAADLIEALTAAQPTTPAPGPVAQGEPSAVAQFMGMRRTPKGTREFWGYVHGSNELTEGELLYRATPAPEQATTGSGQDSGSVHSGSGECGEVQAPTVTDEQFERLWTLFGRHMDYFNANKDTAAVRVEIESTIAAILSTASPAGEGKP